MHGRTITPRGIVVGGKAIRQPVLMNRPFAGKLRNNRKRHLGIIGIRSGRGRKQAILNMGQTLCRPLKKLFSKGIAHG